MKHTSWPSHILPDSSTDFQFYKQLNSGNFGLRLFSLCSWTIYTNPHWHWSQHLDECQWWQLASPSSRLLRLFACLIFDGEAVSVAVLTVAIDSISQLRSDLPVAFGHAAASLVAVIVGRGVAVFVAVAYGAALPVAFACGAAMPATVAGCKRNCFLEPQDQSAGETQTRARNSCTRNLCSLARSGHDNPLRTSNKLAPEFHSHITADTSSSCRSTERPRHSDTCGAALLAHSRLDSMKTPTSSGCNSSSAQSNTSPYSCFLPQQAPFL